jgi:hypothetical protein
MRLYVRNNQGRGYIVSIFINEQTISCRPKQRFTMATHPPIFTSPGLGASLINCQAMTLRHTRK